MRSPENKATKRERELMKNQDAMYNGWVPGCDGLGRPGPSDDSQWQAIYGIRPYPSFPDHRNFHIEFDGPMGEKGTCQGTRKATSARTL